MIVGRWQLGALMTVLWLCGCAVPSQYTALVPTLTGVPPPVSSSTVVLPATPAARTAAPVPSLTPTSGHTDTASLTPGQAAVTPAVLHQLTTGGCCVQPYWSADSRQVRYIDRPSSGQPAGIWGVSLLGGAPVFITARVGINSPDEKLVAYPESGQTYIERIGADRWRVNNGGRAVIFSPDSSHIAWQAASSLFNLDRRQVQVWLAAVDGTGPRQLATLTGGSVAGWFPDGQHLLVTSRAGNNTLVQSLAVADGTLAPILSGPRLQGLALSPFGGWLAYAVAFSGDPSLDGLWVMAANGRGAHRLAAFGGFAWRSEGRLLVIPLDPASASDRVLEADAATGEIRALTDPAATSFQIAQGNWSLSPNGAHLAFVSGADHNIWVLDLME